MEEDTGKLVHTSSDRPLPHDKLQEDGAKVWEK